MKKKTKILLASALVSASIGFSVAAAGCSGFYKLTDFVVDRSSVSLSYQIGDEIDLSKLVLTATFSDNSTQTLTLQDVKIYLNGEELTDPSKITETEGEKTITVTYKSEYGEKSQEFKITVTAEQVILDEITDFNKPAFLAAYESEKKNAADEDKTENEGVFFTAGEQEYYIVGDDNAFKFLPEAKCMDFEQGNITNLTACTVNATVKILEENTETTLVKKAKENAENVYEYYRDNTLMLTENAVKNEYTFAEDALGKAFVLSVLPDSNVYAYDEDTIEAVKITVKVVDGYNAYSADDLAVIDNSGRAEWNALKGLNGLTNVTTNGIVLHRKMELTEKQIPEKFYYTLSDEYKVQYKDENGVSKTPEEWGLSRSFLFDKYNGSHLEIYKRFIADGESFAFYGNYFEVDASKMPLVCAFNPTQDKDGNALTDTWYGTDYSNAVLFRMDEQIGATGTGKFTFNNLALKGNAQNEQLVVDKDNTSNPSEKGETLVRAGGIILTKVNGVEADFENVRTYEFFIPFFAELGARVVYNRTKCYDSFQDALYVWSKTDVQIKNSYFKRAGGPMIIMNHVDPDKDGYENRIPVVTIDENSVLETALTGSEIWFKSVGAESIVTQLRTAVEELVGNFNKSILKDGKMNIVALLMRDATNAADGLNCVDAQGALTYGDAKLDRMKDTDLGKTLHNILSKGALAFNIGDSVFYSDGTNLYNKDGADGSMEMYAASQNANYLGFNQGGISVLFGYYSKQA